MELGEGMGMPEGVSGTGSDQQERQSECNREEISCP